MRIADDMATWAHNTLTMLYLQVLRIIQSNKIFDISWRIKMEVIQEMKLINIEEILEVKSDSLQIRQFYNIRSKSMIRYLNCHVSDLFLLAMLVTLAIIDDISIL